MSNPNKLTWEELCVAVKYATNNGIEIPFDVSRLTKKDLRDVKLEDVITVETPALAAPTNETVETPKVLNRSAWPTNTIEEHVGQAPIHPWSHRIAMSLSRSSRCGGNTRKNARADNYDTVNARLLTPEEQNAILFEAARGVMTYKCIAYWFHVAPGVPGSLARKYGIVRHQNPNIHKGKTSRTRNVS